MRIILTVIHCKMGKISPLFVRELIASTGCLFFKLTHICVCEIVDNQQKLS